jgi:hypothetical protein
MKGVASITLPSAGLTTRKKFLKAALLTVSLTMLIPSLCSGNTIRVLDSDGNVGWDTSLAIKDGLPVISYATRAPVSGLLYLKVAFCADAQCSSWTIKTVDSSTKALEMTSVAIGSDGLPIISYRDRNTGLKVAKCNDATCTSATITEVPSSGQGIYSSITIGHDGLPVISYQTYYILRVLKCGNLSCSSGNVDTLLKNYQSPGYTAIAIGSDNNPVIAHIWSGLDVVWCHNITCTASTVTAVPNVGGREVDIAIGQDGNPVISFCSEQYQTDERLKVAKCNDITCTTSTVSTVDSDGDVGQHTSIAIGADGLPVISYWAWSWGDLRVAKCNNADCSSAIINTVDSVGEVGWFTSIAIGDDGNPVISYYDNTNDDLKLALCSDPACTASPVPHTLSVVKSGTGTVTSDDLGINCGSDCSEQYDQGTVVTLTAQSAAGFTFEGWSGGGCSGKGVCKVTMNTDITVTATFALAPVRRSLTVFKAGPGRVTSLPPGIDCGEDCSKAYTQGTVVTLTAQPDTGAAFTGWSGTCSGTAPQCAFSVNVDTTVTATFARASVGEGSIGTEVTVSGGGFGIKKGKVLIGGVAPKIAKNGWTDDRIVCLLTKVPPVGGPHDITITPYKSAASMILAGAFSVKSLEIDPLDPDHNHGQPGTPITLTGTLFSTKKGKVYIEDLDTGKKKSCKVTEWSMHPANGSSTLTFIVPKLPKTFGPGPYTLKITNKLGVVETPFTVDPLP